ncbi:MAG: hypothetical protein ACOH1R_02910 [Luteimonas sp.]
MSARPTHAGRFRPIRWVLVVAALLCAVAIVWMRNHTPDVAARSKPYVHAGERGQKVLARNFSAEVKTGSPKFARAYLLEARHSGEPPFRLASHGIWVSTVVSLEALEQPGTIGARLRSRSGRIYPAAGADRPSLPGTNLAGTVSSPGLPRSGVFFFELPPDQLEGLHMELFWDLHAPQPWDSVVDIDLGLDPERTRKLLADASAELDLRP